MHSNLQQLLTYYAEDQRIEAINVAVDQDSPAYVRLQGIVGGQAAFVMASLVQKNNRQHLYVAQTKEEAAYFYNTLQSLLPQLTVLFFPDSFKRPMFYEEMDNNNVVQRTTAVNEIFTHQQESIVVVSYPDALFEKVVDPKLLQENKIEIKVGEKLDIDFLIEVMITYGFERTDFVYEPGQFSIRGGIIDIFSYGSDWPFRVELFDEEIESVRSFDPITQLSIEKKDEISLIPNINNKFKQQEKISFFQLLNTNACVWINEFQYIVDRLQSCFDSTETFANSLEGKTNLELREILDERAFIYPHEVVEELKSQHCIQINEADFEAKPKEVIQFEGKPQPSFNKNFSFLIENLQANTKEGIENFIFTENKKQIDRFYNIFADLEAKVNFHPIVAAMHEGFVDQKTRVAVYTDHQIFERFHRYKLKQGFTKDQAINLKMLRELEAGDFVVHLDHGVGRFSGLEKITINNHVQETVRLIYANNDILYVGIQSLHKISKYVGKEGSPPALSKIGGEAWKNLKRKTKSKVKDIAKELIKLYAERKSAKGFAFSEDGYLQTELEASFIYEDTPDQLKATIDVKEDMLKPYPMDRLICGDVGFGKTEVAMRAAFKAITDGKQVAILVPTTILALQHYQTFSERLKQFNVKVNFINRFKTAKEKKEILAELEEGKVELIIGTHALLSKDVKFKDLGLLIIDEEQKFGVSAKEKLRHIKVNVDTLTLTATPIPRTLQFSLMAARDMSIIRTPPPNRQPIHTERRVFNEGLIKDAIMYEVNRGGQVFFVHNRVKSLAEVTDLLRRLCPDVKVKFAHGQMESDSLEKTLIEFIDGDFDVLVCTNIIETGLDITNANTMIINNAHQFGLSDLHQLRGRVGRSNKKAFCYLLSPPLSALSEDAKKRLKTIEEFSDLGSGFNIAMKDMDIRGAGNLLGAEQSGFITDIGYETYQKILEEAVMELKETDFKDLFKEELDKKKEFVKDAEVDTDIEMLIPDAYITNIQERLALYTEMDGLENEEGIDQFRAHLKDRFGPVPKQVESLFNGLRLRWMCRQLGFERLSLKANKLRCYFISNPQSRYFETPQFAEIMNFISSQGNRQGFNLKQTASALILSKENVKSLGEALEIVQILVDRINALT